MTVSIDYTVSSLPSLVFGAPAPLSWERFCEACGGEDLVRRLIDEGDWPDLEIQLRNAVAEARGGAKYARAAEGCSLFWKNRILACFQEKDVAKRDELLDKVWWDAAGELTPPAAPLGRGALATYALRLRIALKRAKISTAAGNSAFDRLTSGTKVTF